MHRHYWEENHMGKQLMHCLDTELVIVNDGLAVHFGHTIHMFLVFFITCSIQVSGLFNMNTIQYDVAYKEKTVGRK